MKTRKISLIITIIVIAFIISAAFYWYFFMRTSSVNLSFQTGNDQQSGFSPYARTYPSGSTTNTTLMPDNIQNSTSTTKIIIPKLRLLSDSPVGGYGTMTNSSTTIVRWIDRGRGNIMEAMENTLDVATLSNTILPKMFYSIWNKNLSSFIGSISESNSLTVNTLSSQLIVQASSTKSSSTTDSQNVSLTPYVLRGSNMPDNIINYASSPKGDKVFLLADESGSGVGYISTFDGKSVTKLFETPLIQLNVDWPEDNTIVISTKGSANQPGYLYFVNAKTGVWKRILGPINGLSAKVSHDAKYVIASGIIKGAQFTNVYNVSSGDATDAVIRTIADKCVWGNFSKEMVYCGVPSQKINGLLPDDWYKGLVSTIDKIWQINAKTGEIHLVSSIVDQSDRVIDTFNLGLDNKDDFLFFMNKNDLSLWSLDLVSASF